MKRYPGIQSFRATDQRLFYGRNHEKRRLIQLIILNEVVVLFGKSGVGKSSLLQAGVCPQLDDHSLHPVFIRLNNSSLSPVEQVYEQLKEQGYIPPTLPGGLTMWEYLKTFQYEFFGESYAPVIVFDQFEELFTFYSPDQRKVFIDQLAEILNERAPQSLQQKIGTTVIDKNGVIDWEAPPIVKFVLSIRSDFLYLLDELSTDIPGILRIRYQLSRLTEKNALQAITKPAKTRGIFESPEFTYDRKALKEILSVLGKSNLDDFGSQEIQTKAEIEASQLQILCQQIENKIIEQQLPTGFVVTSDFYGGAEGIKKIIGDFYREVISRVPAEFQNEVEYLVAELLIRKGRRIFMEESALLEESKIPKNVLHQLNDEKLVRRERRAGSFYYELSHDSLIEAVLKSYQLIKDQKEKEQKEKEKIARLQELEASKRKAEEARQIAQEQTRLRTLAEASEQKARKRKNWALVLSVLMLGLAFWAYAQYNKAESAKNNAELAKIDAESQRDKARLARADADNLNESLIIVSDSLEKRKNELELETRAKEKLVSVLSDRNKTLEETRDALSSKSEKLDSSNQELVKQKQTLEEKSNSLSVANQLIQKTLDEKDTLQKLTKFLYKQSLAQKIALQSLSIIDPDRKNLKSLMAKAAFDLTLENKDDLFNPDLFNALFTSVNQLKPQIFEESKLVDPGAVNAIVISKKENAFYTTGSLGSVLKYTFDSWPEIGKPSLNVNTILPVNSTKRKSNNVHNILALSEDEKWLAIGGKLTEILLFNLSDSKNNGNQKPIRIKHGHGGLMDLQFLDNDNIVSCGADGKVNLYNISTRDTKNILVINEHIQAISVFKDHMFCGTQEGNIYGLYREKGEWTINDTIHTKSFIASLALKPLGHNNEFVLACGLATGEVQVYTLSSNGRKLKGESKSELLHKSIVPNIVFSESEQSSEQYMLSSGYDGTIFIWKIPDISASLSWFENKIKIKAKDSWITALAFSSESNQMIVGSKQGGLNFWSVEPKAYANEICDIIDTIDINKEKIAFKNYTTIDSLPCN